jgi:PTS system mannose-specific IIB component
MPIILVRIDDRLIHGQVVEGWLRVIRVNHITVISDQVARDKVQQALLSMAVPSNIKVTNFMVDEAAQKINGSYFDGDRVLALLSRPQDVLRLLTAGVKFSSVNVGGMHYSPGKRQILRNLSVDDSDLSALQEIGRMGIELEGRVLPSDDRIDIIDAMRRLLGATSDTKPRDKYNGNA